MRSSNPQQSTFLLTLYKDSGNSPQSLVQVHSCEGIDSTCPFPLNINSDSSSSRSSIRQPLKEMKALGKQTKFDSDTCKAISVCENVCLLCRAAQGRRVCQKRMKERGEFDICSRRDCLGAEGFVPVLPEPESHLERLASMINGTSCHVIYTLYHLPFSHHSLPYLTHFPCLLPRKTVSIQAVKYLNHLSIQLPT
jgi:hypothetical protein